MYLVTGGCGFIGSHLVECLLAKGYRVRVLDDLSNSTKKILSNEVEFLDGSIVEETKVRQAIKNVDGIFHLAAKVSIQETVLNWFKTHEVNCGGTVRLFELAKGIPIVFASSAAIYGDNTMPKKEDAQPHPQSPYAADKFACEINAQVAWHLYKTPSIACRLFNVYGAWQNPRSSYSGVISKFTKNLLCNEHLTIYGTGEQRRDFVYVGDIASMLLKLMENLTDGAHLCNLCTGIATSINELADLMSELTNISTKKVYTPALEGDIVFSQGDPSKAWEKFGIKAEVLLRDGLRSFLNAVQSHVLENVRHLLR